jgi:hypothetical protein
VVTGTSSAMHFFQAHQLSFIFLSLFCLNIAKGEVEGHCPGMVTR